MFSLIVSVLTKRHVGDESLLSIKPCEVHCVHNGVSHNVHSAFWIISNKLGHSGSKKNLLHNPNYSSAILICFQVHALFDCFSVTNKCFIVHCAGFLAILHALYPWQLISRCVRPREIDCDRNTIDLIQKPSSILHILNT